MGEDLARFLCMSVNSSVRREQTAELLRHYYSCLEEEFQRMGQKPPFNLEQAVGSYRSVASVPTTGPPNSGANPRTYVLYRRDEIQYVLGFPRKRPPNKFCLT